MNPAASALPAACCGISERMMFKKTSLRIGDFPELAPEKFNFDERHLTRLLEGNKIGKRIHVLAEVDSTNIYAARLAREGAEEGEVVIADSQSRGRGRLNRMWQSPAGKNLYMSIILRPAISPAVSSLITLTAGMGMTPRTMNKIPSVQVILLKTCNDFFMLPSNFYDSLDTY